jgi:hypothetical protein
LPKSCDISPSLPEFGPEYFAFAQTSAAVIFSRLNILESTHAAALPWRQYRCMMHRTPSGADPADQPPDESAGRSGVRIGVNFGEWGMKGLRRCRRRGAFASKATA